MIPQPFNNSEFYLIGIFIALGLIISLLLDPEVKCWVRRKLGKK